jgi:hypothetical protein
LYAGKEAFMVADAYDPLDAVEDSYMAAWPDDAGEYAGEKPDIDTLMAWEMDGVCEALDGCLVEPDGVCPHGHPSWLRYLGIC